MTSMIHENIPTHNVVPVTSESNLVAVKRGLRSKLGRCLIVFFEATTRGIAKAQP